MITVRVDKTAINRALLAEQLLGLIAGYSSQDPYPGWVELAFNDGTSQAEQDAAIAVVAAHVATEKTEAQETLLTIKNLAQSAVGVNLLSLTDAQRWALLGVLLWTAGAIKPDATIAPLNQWT